MIATLLVEHPWVSPTALAFLVLLGTLAGQWLVRRPRLAWRLTWASLIPVGLAALVPTDRELSVGCWVQWDAPTPARVELAGNVVLFVAPVLLAGIAMRRPWLAFVGGIVLSAGLEALQAVVPALGRSCDTNDLLSNSIGALIGAALAWVALRRAARYGPDSTNPSNSPASYQSRSRS